MNNIEMENKYFLISKKYENILNCAIECNFGWLDIIEQACYNINDHVTRTQFENFKIVQIKEKFGQLRIYTSFTDTYIDGVIDMACSMSNCTCEVCGNKGRICSEKPWIRTLCDECNKS